MERSCYTAVVPSSRVWDSAAWAIAHLVRARGDDRSVAQIAAASGLALVSTTDASCSLGSSHAYVWESVLPDAVARLGYACEVVCSEEPPSSALGKHARARALALIERGGPTLVWGVHAPEFGVVLESNGHASRTVLSVSGVFDGAAPPTMDAAELGRGAVPILFALKLTGELALDTQARALAGLRAALNHLGGHTATRAGVAGGSQALYLIARALERGAIDPSGLAYAAQRLAEGRTAAATWLAAPEPTLAPLRRAASLWRELAHLLPYPVARARAPLALSGAARRDADVEPARAGARARRRSGA
jgi:hypothetical protein